MPGRFELSMSAAANSPFAIGYENPGAAVRRLRISIGRFLFCVVTFEAALMGSGRLFEIGPVTVKMILYTLTLFYTIWSLFSLESLKYSTVLLLASFGALVSFGVVNGVVHAVDMKYLGQDVSPLISFLVLPFYELAIRTERDIRVAIRVLVSAALFMATCYAAIFVGLFSGRVSFEALYGWLTRAGGEDFIFEGDSGRLFYKGSLFIGIALILVVFQKGRWAKIAASVLFLNLFAIGVRGFFLSLAVCGILYVFIGPLSVTKKLATGLAVVSLMAVLLPRMLSFFGDKTESNIDRLIAISEVYDRTAPISVLVGHGFGVGVPVRPVHMEIMYLEIFHKQGIVGLLWWAALIGIAVIRWQRAVRAGKGQLAYPLLLSITFVCIESATNPFLNNPIGLYAFIICYVALGVLAEKGKSGSITELVQSTRTA